MVRIITEQNGKTTEEDRYYLCSIGLDVKKRTSLLEKGSRSDRSLTAAISSMYLQGVSTRRVSTVMGELCGFEVSSTQVSKLTAELDGEFKK